MLLGIWKPERKKEYTKKKKNKGKTTDKIQWNLFNLIVVCLGNGVALIHLCSFTIKNAVGITLMYVPPILALGFGAI